MKRLIGLCTLLIVELALFVALERPSWTTPAAAGSYAAEYAANLLAQAGPVLCLAWGMTLVLATAGIDLSVGSQVALVACIMSRFPEGYAFWWTAVPAGLIVAAALGSANGCLVALLDMPPIIATLGTMILFRGLCSVVMADRELAPFLYVPGYQALGQIAATTAIVAALYLVAGRWWARSRWRQELLLMGGNHTAARFAGIRVARRKLEVYTLMGLLAFVAALLFTGRNGSVNAGVLAGLELQVIVAVVLGGTRVQGGVACLAGTALGVLVVAVLDEGLRSAVVWGDTYLPFDINYLRYLLLGLLLVVGVWLNNERTD